MSLQSDNNFISENHEITNVNSAEKKEDFYQSYLNAFDTVSIQENQQSQSPLQDQQHHYAQNYFEKEVSENFISPSKRSKTALGPNSQLPPTKQQITTGAK